MERPLTSKQRATRIPLDYHARPEEIRRWRFVFTGLATSGAVALVAAIGGSRAWHATAVSPGPVARVHATWDAKCLACHESFAPIHSGAWSSLAVLAAASDQRADTDSIADSKCRACHPGAPHHARLALGNEGCTHCHHEHRGRDAPLTMLDDRACTQCHDGIAEFVSAAAVEPAARVKNVTAFHLEHPEFRSLERDPTRLKFNHFRHLTRGLRMPDERQPPWTIGDIAEPFRDRYRRDERGLRAGSADTAAVQLVCADCHRSASSSPPGARLQRADSEGGAARVIPADGGMLPITYEQHCHGCHLLAYRAGWTDTVPHGGSAAELRQVLAGRLWEQQVAWSPAGGVARPRLRPIPGKSSRAADPAVTADLGRRLQEAERQLWGVTCVKCHDLEHPENDASPTVVPVGMPVRWLERARFNHTAHRGVGCQECHERAFADSSEPSTKTSDVLIAGQWKCRECHSPHDNAGHRGGADFRCVECHRYHRPHLVEANSGSQDDFGIEHSLDDFLRGEHARE